MLVSSLHMKTRSLQLIEPLCSWHFSADVQVKMPWQLLGPEHPSPVWEAADASRRHWGFWSCSHSPCSSLLAGCPLLFKPGLPSPLLLPTWHNPPD